MVTWRGDAWLAEAVELGRNAVTLPGIDGTLAVVTTGRQGELTIVWEIVAGRVVNARRVAGSRRQPLEGVDVTFTAPEDDAMAMLAGALQPSVAFMRGRLKTSGDPGLVLAVLAGTASDDFAAWRRQLLALTDAEHPRGAPAP